MSNLEPLRIAPKRGGDGEHWTSVDWHAIKFASEEDWKKGIGIFEDRIRGRFFDIVEKIKDEPYSGFAVMAIDCLLIETLEQFYRGEPETPRGQSKARFRDFLSRRPFSLHFDESKADKFYRQIRNGILHQAEIKESSRILTRSRAPLVELAADGIGLVINRRKFHELMIQAFGEYLSGLLLFTEDNDQMRVNLKEKMDWICR